MNSVLSSSFASFSAWLGGLGLPGWLAWCGAAAVFYALPLFAVVLPIAGLGQIFERKIAAAMQRRIGPSTTGILGVLRLTVNLCLPWKGKAACDRLAERLVAWGPVALIDRIMTRTGVAQLLADGVKMIGKEDLVPAGVDGVIYRCAPYLVILGAFLPFVVVPWSQHLVMADLSIGVVWVAASGGFTAVAILMAGWGSNNKWTMLGGMRAVAQIVSYEIPVGLCVAAVAMWSGTLSLQQMVASQYHPGMLSFAGWNIVQSPFMVVLAGTFFLAAIAECQRTPFDTAEAESELVSGYNTEMSGLRWGLFAMAEYTETFLIGALFAVMFLGGYQSPIGEEWISGLPPLAETLVHGAILTGKCLLAIWVMMWIRWTLPRFRIDQVMRLAWLTLVPLALVCLLGLALTMLLAARIETVAYGPLLSAPAARLGLAGWAASWLVAGGAIALLVVAAKRSAPPVPAALRRLTAPVGGG